MEPGGRLAGQGALAWTRGAGLRGLADRVDVLSGRSRSAQPSRSALNWSWSADLSRICVGATVLGRHPTSSQDHRCP